MSYSRCTEVTPECPVEATTYAYYPNLGGNAFLCAGFALCALLQLFFGIRYRTWTWLVALFCGAAFEAVGYGGRIMMNANPWSDSGFKIQIVCLVICPSFLSAGINLVLKHFVLVFGSEHSMIKPALYTWLFIGTDIFSLLLQAAGGGIAASADTTDRDLLMTGNNLILAGIAVQVAQIVLFGTVTAWFLVRLRRRVGSIAALPPRAQQYMADRKFRGFLGAVCVAYVTILIRCIYRLPEMAGGWGSELQQHEDSFLVLDGMMILIAVLALTIFHPGYCFPHLSKKTSLHGESFDSQTEEKEGKVGHA